MKTLNTKHLISLLVMSLILTIGQGQEESASSDLIGTWIIDNTATMEATPQENMEQLELFPEIKEQIMASYIGRILNFNADGTFSQSLADGTGISGIWQVSNNILLLTTEDGSSQQQEFSILVNGSLLLSIPDQEQSRHLVPNQYFIKQ